MTRYQRPLTRKRPRDGSRQIWAVVAMGLAVAVGALATDEYVAAKRRAAAAAAVAVSAQSDDEIYTGSILYTPNEGNICRQLLFDNHNGHIIDNGYVDCERAAYRSALDEKRWSKSRLRVISSGFLQH